MVKTKFRYTMPPLYRKESPSGEKKGILHHQLYEWSCRCHLLAAGHRE
ncbi:MAG: hypothetical protein U0U70_06450 [Chitinophagaceae bacterium]